MKSSKSKYLRTSGVISSLIILGLLNMGNQSCANPNQTGVRALKMDAGVGKLAAQKITMPSGETVDFPYVINGLFYEELMNSDYLTISGGLPQVTPQSSQMDLVTENSSVTALRKYGLISAEFAATADEGSQNLACTYNTPELAVSGQVTDFSASAGGGLDIGYGKNPTSGGTIDITYTETRLQLSLELDRPLYKDVLLYGDGESSQKSISAKLGSGIVGFNFFLQTSIADVIKNSIDSAILNIVKKYALKNDSDWNKDWESKVAYCQNCDGDTHIGIRGGTQNGIKKGDKFKISNVTYQWEDNNSPCQSQLIASLPDDLNLPTAYGTVAYVEDHFSILEITKYNGTSKIRLGAKVQLESFYVEPIPTK